jgi:Xaa-Pro aminopeptidase
VFPTAIVEPSTLLHEMRITKSDLELDTIRQAVGISAVAHHAVMSQVRPSMREYELEAILRYEFRRNGSERCAYESIVASGPNARTLHYRRNDRTLQDGDLVLVDAGAEYHYMASDITRTFPCNGRFAPLQRKAYEVVLDAQRAAMDTIAPGVTLDDVHMAAVRVLCTGLIELGILAGPVEQVLESEAYKKYYMHRTSHWMGLDVHDVGAYYVEGRPRPLAPGMVLTVEPGLYFPDDELAVPVGLRNCGIRIEDDVRVTETGVENLSSGIAKTVDEIEALMANGRTGEPLA